eukprot:2242210-Pleurochrysis_carterae.AAC.2
MVYIAAILGCGSAICRDYESGVRAQANFTASNASVMQYMPAPVSPNHIVLALAAAIAGVDSMTDVCTACASASPRRCAK